MLIELRASLLAAACLFGSGASAATRVDTGDTGTITQNMALNSYQMLGSEFTVTRSSTITSIEGYFVGYGSLPAPIAYAIYTNNIAGTPGSLINYTTGVGPTNGQGWYGASFLPWILGPGTYWAVFAKADAGGYPSSTGGLAMPNVASSPLAVEAFSSLAGWYVGEGTLKLGIRIHVDDVSEVPLPASGVLLLFGIAGLGLRARRHCGA